MVSNPIAVVARLFISRSWCFIVCVCTAIYGGVCGETKSCCCSLSSFKKFSSLWFIGWKNTDFFSSSFWVWELMQLHQQLKVVDRYNELSLYRSTGLMKVNTRFNWVFSLFNAIYAMCGAFFSIQREAFHEPERPVHRAWCGEVIKQSTESYHEMNGIIIVCH